MNHKHFNNEYYIQKFTKEAEAFYLAKMQKLAPLGLDNTYNKNGKRFHADNFLMYKLPTSYVDGGKVGYEFLIEYEVGNPSVGIYYGCKAYVADGDLDYWLNRFTEEWLSVKNVVCQSLNNLFPDKDFSQRFKVTDNANDGNFWPFWITLYEDEDIIDVGVRAIEIIKKIYDKYIIDKEPFEQCEIKQQKKLVTETAFTNSAYQTLLNYIGTPVNKTEVVFKEGITLFEKTLEDAERNKILVKNVLYEKAWEVQVDSVEFSTFIVELFQKLRYLYKSVYGRNFKEKVPWNLINKIFLNGHGFAYGKDNLRISYQKKDEYGRLRSIHRK